VSVTDQTGSSNSCSSTDCTISSTYAPALTLPTFKTNNTNYNIEEDSGSFTIGSGGTHSVNNMKKLFVTSSAKATFNTSATDYIIKEGKFANNAEITFNPGTYWFKELEIDDSAKIFINGPVTIYVKNHFDIEGNSQVNHGGDPKDLAIVSYAQIHLKDDVKVAAVVYGAGSDVQIKDNAQLTGALSAKGLVELKNNGKIIYQDINGVAIGSLCDGTPVIVHHFQISHDGNGATCVAESVTIKACADANCSTLVNSTISLNFQADGVTKSSPSF
jgi:hypothetical protein